jgi:hypothetical protein
LSNYIYNYDWEVEPKITADDIIVYNLEEKGYDHSIFNNLAYIKRDSKYGIRYLNRNVNDLFLYSNSNFAVKYCESILKIQ